MRDRLKSTVQQLYFENSKANKGGLELAGHSILASPPVKTSLAAPLNHEAGLTSDLANRLFQHTSKSSMGSA